jgi:hypothetical protein
VRTIYLVPIVMSRRAMLLKFYSRHHLQHLKLTFIGFALLCVSCAVASASPGVTVIAVDHLDYHGFLRTQLPNIVWLREIGAVGLVSPGLARFPDPVGNEWATFTAGDVINTKDEHIDLLNRQLLANGAGESVQIDPIQAGSLDGTLQSANILIETWRQTAAIGSTLIFVAITPPQSVDGSWDELMPMAMVTAGRPPGGSLTSATTRTKGLVALRDLTPTILDLVHAPIPISMTGAPVQIIALSHRDAVLSRMAAITQLGQKVIVALSWFLGLSALFAVAGGAWFAAGSRPGRAAVVCYLLRLILCAPLALLAAPCLPLTTVSEYLAALIGIDMVLAFIPSTTAIMVVTSVVVLIDGVTGSSLIAATVVSGYWLSGIRFYGIGNEFMGVLIASSLLVPVLLRQNVLMRLADSTFLFCTAIYYLVVVFILSYPEFGAKAGGTITSVAALGPAWYAVATRKQPNWLTLVVACCCGFLLVFGLAGLAHLLHAPPSHIQAAVAAVHHGRLGYIKHVAVRKAKMAVKTVLTPGGIVACVAVIPLWIFWLRSRLRERVANYLATRQEMSGAFSAGYWALIAGLLFNDSGGVACLFIFGATSLVLLHELVRSECVYSR